MVNGKCSDLVTTYKADVSAFPQLASCIAPDAADPPVPHTPTEAESEYTPPFSKLEDPETCLSLLDPSLANPLSSLQEVLDCILGLTPGPPNPSPPTPAPPPPPPPPAPRDGEYCSPNTRIEQPGAKIRSDVQFCVVVSNSEAIPRLKVTRPQKCVHVVLRCE